MKTIENGTAVKLHYKGTFPNGETFDDSKIRGEALNVLIGHGQVIRGLEAALLGMSEGETKKVELSADEAYGQPVSEAIITAPRTAFPDNFEFQEGMSVTGRGPTGQPMHAKIISFTDTEVVLDHNHPLAGKDINFEIEILEILNSSGGSTDATTHSSTDSYDNYTVKELRAFAKERGLKGYSTMKKAELVESLTS